MITLKKTLVAEISKNYPGDGECIAQRFERVIEYNAELGYKLASWKLSRIIYTAANPSLPSVNETIIAVFEMKDQPT